MSANTIIDYLKPIRALSRYAENNDIKIFKTLSDEKHLAKFTNTLVTEGNLKLFAGLLSHLSLLGINRTGVKVITGSYVDVIRQKRYQIGSHNQTAVIPPRILNELVKELTTFLKPISDKIENIDSFIKHTLEDERFARCEGQQRSNGYKVKDLMPTFNESAKIYGLERFFKKYNIEYLKNFSSLITKTQHACKLLIFIYSGMRNSEAVNLKVGCLKKEFNSNKPTYQLFGETSKLIGKKKKTSWITSEAIVSPINILETFATSIGSSIELQKEETPLFISAVYLGYATAFSSPSKHINLLVKNQKSQEVYNLINMENMRITQDDLNFLEKIDPFRAWSTDEKFKLDSIWNFTSHQFRRSLAYYVLQSGLVSLPALKRQLKHLSREMVLYYCQTHDLEDIFDKKNHISHTIRKLKPEVDALAYFQEVLLSDEHLFGAGGKFIEKNNKYDSQKLLKESRKTLITQFKKGERSYMVTPLGACTTIKPCNEKATRIVAACISCDKAIIKKSKLDKVIELQSKFVDELESNDRESIEFRTETSELNTLKSFRDQITIMENK